MESSFAVREVDSTAVWVQNNQPRTSQNVNDKVHSPVQFSSIVTVCSVSIAGNFVFCGCCASSKILSSGLVESRIIVFFVFSSIVTTTSKPGKKNTEPPKIQEPKTFQMLTLKYFHLSVYSGHEEWRFPILRCVTILSYHPMLSHPSSISSSFY